MTTLNLQVAASADDAFENAAGAVTTNGTAIGTLSTGNMWAGFRWAVAAPQGVTVSSATAQFYVNSTSFDDLVFDLYAQAADTAAAFTTTTNDVSGRARTTAKTGVNAASVGVGWYSVDVKAAAQEVIDRAGWADGNYLALIIDALAGINFQCRAYDGDTSLAAKLDITYVDPSTGQPMVARGRLVPGMRRPHGHQGW